MSLEALRGHLAAIGKKDMPYIGVTFEDEDEDDYEDEYYSYEELRKPEPQQEQQQDTWVDSQIDGDKLLCDMFKPGVNHVTDGMRGGGKTYQAIAYAQPMVEGKIKGMTKTILLTNVIFLKRVAETGLMEDDFIMETPPNVYHITSMEEIFRYATRFMKQYGRENVQFLVVLDEVQNFLLAEEYQTDLQITFVKWYGTTRKFNVCLWMLTPSINNLPPRARNFMDDDTKSGYVSYRWRKNKIAASRYVQEHNIRDVNLQTFTTLTTGAHEPPRMIRVIGTSWTKDVKDVKIGEYCYDHLACADFKLSIHKDEEGNETFDFNRLMELCSDLPSYMMAKVMGNFFDQMDGRATEDIHGNPVSVPTEDTDYERALQIRKMRDMGLKIKQIAYIMKKPESTIRSWHDKCFDPKTGQPLKAEYAYDGQPTPFQAQPQPERTEDSYKAPPKNKPRGNAARKVKKSMKNSAGSTEGVNTPSEGYDQLSDDVSSLESSSESTTPFERAYISIPKNEGIEGGSGEFSPSSPIDDDSEVATGATPSEDNEDYDEDDEIYDEDVDLTNEDDEESYNTGRES